MYGLRREGCYLFIQTTSVFGISNINGKHTFTLVCSGEREARGRDQAPIISLLAAASDHLQKQLKSLDLHQWRFNPCLPAASIQDLCVFCPYLASQPLEIYK